MANAVDQHLSDLEQWIVTIIKEDRRLKEETRKLEALKKDVLGMMQADNIGAVDVKEGKITVCTRTAKDYGQTYRELEAKLKAEKTYLEDLGRYTITSVTHYLRVG
ncbi:MAG: hypothetical protein FJ211_10500 [Ignavibacteria bacterium]|nr:hypothetical protein [Ignavibacteria bacterium]